MDRNRPSHNLKVSASGAVDLGKATVGRVGDQDKAIAIAFVAVLALVPNVSATCADPAPVVPRRCVVWAFAPIVVQVCHCLLPLCGCDECQYAFALALDFGAIGGIGGIGAIGGIGGGIGGGTGGAIGAIGGIGPLFASRK